MNTKTSGRQMTVAKYLELMKWFKKQEDNKEYRFKKRNEKSKRAKLARKKLRIHQKRNHTDKQR